MQRGREKQTKPLEDSPAMGAAAAARLSPSTGAATAARIAGFNGDCGFRTCGLILVRPRTRSRSRAAQEQDYTSRAALKKVYINSLHLRVSCGPTNGIETLREAHCCWAG